MLVQYIGLCLARYTGVPEKQKNLYTYKYNYDIFYKPLEGLHINQTENILT